MKKFFILFLTLSVAAFAYAQDTLAAATKPSVYNFASTRPSFAEGVKLVPTGKAQVELGVAYNYFNPNSHEIHHPDFMLKYGISNYFELRINGDATTYKSGDFRQTGLHPVYIGVKLKMIDAKKYAPGSSFIGGLSVNFISTKNFKTKYVAPFFKITMEQFLPKNVGLIYNYGLVWNGEDAKPTYNFAVATSYTKLLTCTTAEKQHQIKYFFEIYGIYPQGKQVDLRINNGIAYLLNKFLQVDVSVGAGLLKNAPRVITSAGLVLRFPKKDNVKQKKKS